MAMQLVEQWLTEAALFTADGETSSPANCFTKSPSCSNAAVSFRPLTNPCST